MFTLKNKIMPFLLGVLLCLVIFAIKEYKNRPKTVFIPKDIAEHYKSLQTPSWLYDKK